MSTSNLNQAVPHGQRVKVDEIKKAIADNLPGTANPNAWILCSYVPPSFELRVTATGKGGVNELVTFLKDDEVQYMLIRLPDSKGGTDTIKDVYISWAGPKVKQVEKARKKGADALFMKNLLQPHHAALEAIAKTNFNYPTVLERSSGVSGSHVLD